MVSANDYPDRNPRTWSLWGMKEGSQSFKVIHFVETSTFNSFWEQKDFDIAHDKATTKYVAVQLQIKDVQKKGGGIQVGQFFLSQQVNDRIYDDGNSNNNENPSAIKGTVGLNPALGLGLSLSNLSIQVDPTQPQAVLDVPVEQSPNNPGQFWIIQRFLQPLLYYIEFYIIIINSEGKY